MTPPTSLIKSLFDIACLRVDKSDQQEMRWEVQWNKMFSSGSHSQSHLIMLWLHRLWLTAHWRISLNLTFTWYWEHPVSTFDMKYFFLRPCDRGLPTVSISFRKSFVFYSETFSMQFFLNLIEFCDIFRHYIFYSASLLETENILTEHLFHHRTFI